MKKRKLVLLGLDSADWKILDPLIKEGCLPNFRHIVKNGSCARLRSTLPPITPPAWASIFTGVNPGKHGIFDFVRFADNKIQYTTSRDVEVPYVWELMGKERIIAFNIPAAYPPTRSENTIMICGFGSPSTSSNFTYPKEIKWEILKAVPGYEVSLGANDHLLEKGIVHEKKSLSMQIIKNLDCKKRAARYLLENKAWDTAFIVFSSPDWIQHFFIHEFFAAEKKSQTEVAMVYKSIDDFLGYLIKKGYNIMVVSDHGAAEIKRKFFLNTYLMRKGLLKLKNPGMMKRTLRFLGISRDFFTTVWPFSSIYELLAGSKTVIGLGARILPTQKLKTDDIDNEKSVAFLISADGSVKVRPESGSEEIRRMLAECTNPDGRAIFKDVFLGSEIYWGGAAEKAPSILAVPHEDIQLRETIEPDIFGGIDPKKEKNGGHSRFGIFAAYGPDFRKKGGMQELSVVDITPTILAYFGYSPPSFMDGKFIPIFEAESKSGSNFKYKTQSAIKKLKRLKKR